MRYLKTSEAAALLNVSPNTLRAWERRFGFPRPQRSEGRHRMFTHGEILALRDALHDGLSISSAVSRAREGLVADSDSLLAALCAFERERADAAMEGALALRTLERAVEEVLLATLEEVARRSGPDSAVWAFAAEWGNDWLRRARRIAAMPQPHHSILFGDATCNDLDPDAPPLRALELLCARHGLGVFSLSVRGATGLADALTAHPCDAVVIAGRYAENDVVARWAYAARTATGGAPIAVFRRGHGRGGPRLVGALPEAAGAAVQRVVELTRGERTGTSLPATAQRRLSA